MEFAAPDDSGWFEVAPAEDVVAGARFRVAASTHKGWEGEPVAIFVLAGGSEVYAISDPCPHVAIGSLHSGDACAKLGDLEDIASSGLNAAVLCPVHSYAFDLETGHCITDKSRQTPAANVYNTRIATINNPGLASSPQTTSGIATSATPTKSSSSIEEADQPGRVPTSNISRRVLQIQSVPRPKEENRVSLEAGNKAQLHLVQLALTRKYGAMEEDEEDDGLSDLLIGT